MQDKSSIEPQSSVSSPALKAVFDAAQETARAREEAEMQAFLARQRREAERKENLEFFRELAIQELGPLFSILTSLPEKDGKRFSVEEKTYETDEYGYEARIIYDAPESRRHYFEQPATTFNIRRVEGQFELSTTQEYTSRQVSFQTSGHETREAPNFDAVRREFGVGLAHFAPDRLAEIGAAFATAAEKPETVAPPVIAPMGWRPWPARRLTMDTGWDSD